jgi:ectoine hydroxylase-related dioxygenase (phytanoyl-CoA dioxygenase family)|tara:strand:- start:136 stop:924 length:789 start_codon:yes stop_codon:yes gene_type:complete
MNKSKVYKDFWNNGYIIIKNFISKKDIQLIFNQVNDLVDISLSEKNKSNKNYSLDKKYLKLKKINPKLKSHLYDLTKYCDSLVGLAGSKKFLDYAKTILNSKTAFIDTPQVRIDHPKEKLNLPQHQELNQLSKDVITFWIPLVNINKKTGGIFFRPKTHKLGHVKYKNSNMSATEAGANRQKIIDKLFKNKDLKKYKSFTPSIKAGDAIIFHSFIFHGTKANKTNKIRWTYISRYNSINNAPYLKKESASLRIPYDADYNLI